MYLLQIGENLCYRLGQVCFITNQSKCGYELGQLLQIRTTVITKQGSYQKLGKMSYKLEQVLQIRAIITNWGITASVELFWVFWGLRLLEFLYLLRAVKPCLRKVCKIVFCITPVLTALKSFFTTGPPLLEAIFGFYLVCFVVFLSVSLENFLVSDGILYIDS